MSESEGQAVRRREAHASAAVTLDQVPVTALKGVGSRVAGRLERQYRSIVDDPAFVIWHYQRQPVQQARETPRRSSHASIEACGGYRPRSG